MAYVAGHDDSSASGHDEPWIQWFCGLRGHEMFCEVERSYIEDGFNLYGLRAAVPNFSDCLDLILDRHGHDDSDDSHLTQNACTLYCLIHARYIITAHGLDSMYNKYIAKEFGCCPLIQCNGQSVLPVGLKDEIGSDSVKIFCPKCRSVYHPPSQYLGSSSSGSSSSSGQQQRGSNSYRGNVHIGVDGASIGTTFPHLFLMTFSNLVPDSQELNTTYVPRIFGFKVHSASRGKNSITNGRSSRSTTTRKDESNDVGSSSWKNGQGNGKCEDGHEETQKRASNDIIETEKRKGRGPDDPMISSEKSGKRNKRTKGR